MSNRIIGGSRRHRLIKTPVNPQTRASKDIVKEGIFSALGYKIIKAEVLDLFAGTGALGLEAASRGASKVYFNDLQPVCIRSIKENCQILDFQNVEFLNFDYLSALRFYAEKGLRFDIIFLDPPYNGIPLVPAVEEILKLNVLQDDGVIVAESETKIDLPTTPFTKIKQYRYGRTFVHIGWRKV